MTGAASSTAKAIEVPEERIFEAIKRDDIAQLRRWARQGLRVTSDRPLARAVCLGKLGMAQYLVQELGAEVNEADDTGYTPLSFAAGKGDLAMVRCLVKKLGADVNKANLTGATPLHVAVWEGKLAVVRCLVKELGADVNKVDNAGYTPLNSAAGAGDLTIVHCLGKELDADVNQADQEGATPLYFAAHGGKLAVVQCLVKELGADINQATQHGGTPLMTAAANKHSDVVKWLIKAGADTQATLFEVTDCTAADFSRHVGASADQTAYLEAKTHCSNPGCSGAGLLKCTGCKQARYCGEACQLAHWKAHKADCRRWSAELVAGSRNASKW
jgi:ankyrin repeat protein